MNEIKIDITGVINNMDFDKEKIKQYDGDFKKIATDLLKDNARISLEKVSLEQKNNNLQSKIDKAIDYLYEHSQYNDGDGVHYIKEDEYCVDYLLDILKGDK